MTTYDALNPPRQNFESRLHLRFLEAFVGKNISASLRDYPASTSAKHLLYYASALDYQELQSFLA